MSNSDNNANSSQYPMTNTDMFVNMLANSDKLKSEDKRYMYNGEKNPELDDDHSNYISEKNNNSEHHTDTKNTDTRNTDTKNTDTRNTDTRNSESHNNTQTEKKDDSVKKDDDENLTAEELMLRKLDMLESKLNIYETSNIVLNGNGKILKSEDELSSYKGKTLEIVWNNVVVKVKVESINVI
jgi:hypothetical protein